MGRVASVAGLAACVGALALTGCGTKVIDQGKAEKYTKQILETNGAGTTKSVTCPSDVEVKKGKTFECTATLTTGKKVKVTFTMIDSKGTVQPTKATPA
jgi:hypothetical protein